MPPHLARKFNDGWNIEHVNDSLSGGRRLKYLAVANDLGHGSVDIVAGFITSGQCFILPDADRSVFCLCRL